MGEEVTQCEVVTDSAGSVGIDETDKCTPAPIDVIEDKKPIEKCEGSSEGSANQQPERSPKKPPKPQDNSFEKSKKWYNIGFMQRAGSANNSRSTNTVNKKNSMRVDKSRHSWHLNDALEMWVDSSHVGIHIPMVISLLFPFFWGRFSQSCVRLRFLFSSVARYLMRRVGTSVTPVLKTKDESNSNNSCVANAY